MTLTQKIASILAGFAIAGCGGTQTVPNQPIQKPVATVTQNLATHQADVERRIAKFHPVIQDEYRNGEFKVDFKETDNKRLNASYNPKTNQIKIDCTPKFERCNTSAIEHEIAHYIDTHLPEDEQKKVYTALKQRVAQPDMEKFREEVSKLNEIRDKMATLLDKNGTIIYCRLLLKEIQFAEEFVDYGNKILWIDSLNATSRNTLANRVQDLETLIQVAKGQWPSCNQRNLKETSRIMLKVAEAYDTMTKQIYHQGKDNIPIKSIRLDVPLEPINDEEFYELTGLIGNGVEDIVSKGISKARQAFYKDAWVQFNQIEPMTPEDTKKLVIKVDDVLNINSIKSLISDYRLLQFKYGDIGDNTLQGMGFKILPSHDGLMPEQFAAGVDSLLARYKGPVETGPMHYELDKPILDVLADVEYKGKKIFADAVNKY